LFTSRNSDGAHLLVFHAEEVTQPDYRQRHVAAPTTEQTLKGLRRGEVSMRDALTASWMWLIEHDESGQPVGAAEITLSDLPDNLLPSPTTMISAELEPALILKFEGADIRDGNVPASIIKAAGEAVQASLREITDFLA